MIIGITGASGSGKSTISKLLKDKFNCHIIDADEIVKSLSKKGNIYYNEIVKIFGEDILDEHKEIIRSKLAEIVYSDNDKREILNNLTNIYVVEKIKQETFNIAKEGRVIIDVPRLIESGLNKICDVIIGIIAEKEVRLNRICNRDNIDRKIAEKRLQIQPNNKFYVDNSDYIIENNRDNLEEKVDLIVNKLRKDNKFYEKSF